jgi:hypothetical protein
MNRVGTRWLPALCAAWTLMAMTVGAAPVTPESDSPKADNPVEKARKALDQTRDLDIVDRPLPEAITLLREQTKINFVLDTNTIMAFLGDPNSFAVTVKQKNVKVRTALRTMLSPYHLSYVIVGDSVIVSTEEMALQRQLRQRVSVDLDAVPLGDALKKLARETATNLLIDGKVKKDADTAVSVQLDDVPLETAIRLLSEMAGLKPVRLGNVLYVTSKANAAEIRNDPDLITGQPGGAVQPQPNVPPNFAFPPGAVPVPGIGVAVPGGVAPPPPAVVPEVTPPKDPKEDAPKAPPKDDPPKPAPKEEKTKDEGLSATFVKAPVTEVDKPVEEPAAEKLRKALQKIVSFEIVDQPLEAAVAQLKQQANINLVLDRGAGNGAVEQVMVPGGGIAVIPGQQPVAPQTVTLKAKNMKLRDALKTMLSGHNLAFAIVGDSVYIAPEEAVFQRQLRQPVSLDLDAVSVAKALKQLARETGANLVLDPKLKKESETAVTLQLEDVPLDTAVRLLCESAGLKPVRMGNIVYVTSKANANELRADPELVAPSAAPIQAREELMMRIGGPPAWGGAIFAPAIAPPAAPSVLAAVPDPADKDKQPAPASDKKSSGDGEK